jgi:hypothetical protein
LAAIEAALVAGVAINARRRTKSAIRAVAHAKYLEGDSWSGLASFVIVFDARRA